MSTSVRTLFVVGFTALVWSTAAAQEVSLAVLPFGALPTARGAYRAGPALGQEAVTIAGVSGLYAVIDRSSDAAIEGELKRAEGFRNFDSKVQLKTTGRLNASVLLIGVIEQQSIEMVRATKRGDKPSYTATLGIRVKLVRTQTGELIKSTFFTLRNGTAASEAADAKGLGRFVPQELKDAVTKQIDDKVKATAARSNVDLAAHSETEAIRAAATRMQKPLSEFLEQSYGAVVAASKAK